MKCLNDSRSGNYNLIIVMDNLLLLPLSFGCARTRNSFSIIDGASANEDNE